MKGDELTVQIPFMRVRRGLGVHFQEAGEGAGYLGPPLPTALWLARAHALEQTLRDCGPGALRVLAQRVGATPQRLVLIHALVFLAPDLQEAVLLSKPEASRVTFDTLVRIARMPVWSNQREAWQKVAGAGAGNERAIGAGNPRAVTENPRSAPQKSSRSGEQGRKGLSGCFSNSAENERSEQRNSI